MKVGYQELIEAIQEIDPLAEENDFQFICDYIAGDKDALAHVGEQRALRAVAVLLRKEKPKEFSGPVVLTDREKAMLPTLMACVIDGLVTGIRACQIAIKRSN